MWVRVPLAAPSHMPLSIQQEALESQLESLLAYQQLYSEGHACVICLGTPVDDSCTCETPSWWPIAYVIKRIEAQLDKVERGSI